MKQLLLFVVLALIGAHAAASDLTHFFSDVHSYSAKFEQIVKDDNGKVIQKSSGTLWIERPNKFRWDYDKPYEQKIIGDGKRVWIYDIGLEQITVRPMQSAVGDSPAMLLAGQGRLDDAFEIKDPGKGQNHDWVELKPKKRDTEFANVRLGFQRGSLAVVELKDSFGQTTRIDMRDYQENKPIDSSKFNFTPPPGVDIIEQ